MSTTIKLFIFFVFIIKSVNCGNCCGTPQVYEGNDNDHGNVVVDNPGNDNDDDILADDILDVNVQNNQVDDDDVDSLDGLGLDNIQVPDLDEEDEQEGDVFTEENCSTNNDFSYHESESTYYSDDEF